METPRFQLPLVRTRQELLGQGLDDGAIRAALRSGALIRVRRGCYVDAAGATGGGPATLMAAVGAVSTAQDQPVFSHATAAALWQLPTLGPPDRTIHVTLPGPGHGLQRAGVHRHHATLAPEDLVEHRGIRLTSLPRTLVDVARLHGLRAGLVMADHAMHHSVDPEVLRRAMLTAVRRLSGRVGIGRARAMAALARPEAESPGESLSRLLLQEQHVPEPVLQFRLTVRLPGGGRGDYVTDFAWKRQKAVGEFDGRAKYERYLREGQTPGDAVFEEKRREDAIRSAGWLVLRWTWADLDRPDVLGRRLREVLAARTPPEGSRPVA